MCSAQLGGCFLAPRTVWLACVGRLVFLCVCAFVCVPLMVSCSGFGLPLHAQLLRLFVTSIVAQHTSNIAYNTEF